jgi:hypothetical protein
MRVSGEKTLSARLRHAVAWRWNMYAEPRVARARTTFSWYFKSCELPHKLPRPLIVSLTSYPPLFGVLAHTVRSLLRQTAKADRTILWVAHADMPLLPKNVTNLQKAGLEIRATDDIKSYKKIIPALDAFPDAFICTADDDLYYWPRWLEELIEASGRADRLVACHRAHEVVRDSGGVFLPYEQWTSDTHFRGERDSLFPTGIGGILYPPGTLAHSTEDRRAAFDLCPQADDVWLYWIGRRNGARYKTAGRWRPLVVWEGTQEQSLWHDNVLRGGNDAQIRKMAERYGYPE